MTVGAWGCGDHHLDVAMMRLTSKLSRHRRLELQVERVELLRMLDQLDDQAQTLASNRVVLLTQLAALRERLYPRIPYCHGRRPPVHDRPPLPPVHPDATWLRGRSLRRVVLGVLARQGPMELVDLHATLHLTGYRIVSHHPGKTLADALRYEVGLGNAERVRRGVYAIGPHWVPPRRRQPDGPAIVDPIVAWDPAEWPDHDPDDRTGMRSG